jgi:GTP-binding protein Era
LPRPKREQETTESESQKMKKAYRAGFAAIVGRPNAGKSTLVNRLVGQKVAIVTAKPQTTRNRIQGIVTRDDGQVVLIDTPGLHEARTVLNRQMMKEVAAALEGIDVLVLVVDASEAVAGGKPHVDPLLVERGKRFAGKTVLALNKVDKVPKQRLLPLMEAFGKAHPFTAMVPISALKGDGSDDLLGEVMKLVPESEPYFPADQVTDQPERFLASEIVREKAIALTYHEVPHALAVAVDKWEETAKLLRIQMTLTVERPAQKKIVIGHKGQMLKKIGTQARKELEEILGAKIFLGLFVKVTENWRENPMAVRELDWHSQLEALEKYNAQ